MEIRETSVNYAAEIQCGHNFLVECQLIDGQCVDMFCIF